jgi:hypothetical protein
MSMNFALSPTVVPSLMPSVVFVRLNVGMNLDYVKDRTRSSRSRSLGPAGRGSGLDGFGRMVRQTRAYI